MLSPSRHSLACRSRYRGVEAIRNRPTADPFAVVRNSGSSTRLPTTVTTVSPNMGRSFRDEDSDRVGGGLAQTGVAARDGAGIAGRGAAPRARHLQRPRAAGIALLRGRGLGVEPPAPHREHLGPDIVRRHVAPPA